MWWGVYAQVRCSLVLHKLTPHSLKEQQSSRAQCNCSVYIYNVKMFTKIKYLIQPKMNLMSCALIRILPLNILYSSGYRMQIYHGSPIQRVPFLQLIDIQWVQHVWAPSLSSKVRMSRVNLLCCMAHDSRLVGFR